MAISTKEEDKTKDLKWDIDITKNDRWYGFGFFKMPVYNDTQRDIIIDKYFNNLVKDLQKTFSDNRSNFYDIKYKLAAMVSIMNDPAGHYKQANEIRTPEHAELVFNHLKRLLNRRRGQVYSSAGGYLDHLFFYYESPNEYGRPNHDTMNRRKKQKFLTIESHPYMDIGRDDILFFAEIMKLDPSLQIEIHPNSHYFVNHTIYLKFIFDTENKELKDEIKRNGYRGALDGDTGDDGDDDDNGDY